MSGCEVPNCVDLPTVIIQLPEYGDKRTLLCDKHSRWCGDIKGCVVRPIVREHAAACSWSDIDHFAEHPCGKPIIDGVTTCDHCGNLDGSPECAAAGCWVPATAAHIDSLYAEAWGIPDSGAPS